MNEPAGSTPRAQLRRARRISATAVALAVMIGATMVPAPAQPVRPGVLAPNFWDPQTRAERPSTGTVTGIRFVTTDDYPPFNFMDATGRLTGFNVDLARAVCAELSISCTIQARPWDDLPAAIIEGRADAAIAGMAITANSRQSLAFSDVYLRSPARFVVRRETAGMDVSPEALKGHSVAVVAKTAHEAYLAAFYPDVERRAFDTAEAARTALKAGSADALFGDGVQLSFWLQGKSADGCCVFAGGPYLESRFFGLGFAIAVAPKSSDLRRALNAALQAVHDKGIYAELYLRYFPVGFF